MLFSPMQISPENNRPSIPKSRYFQADGLQGPNTASMTCTGGNTG